MSSDAKTKIAVAEEEALGMELMKACEDCDLEKARELIFTKGASAAFVHNPEGVWGSRNKKSVLHAALGSMPRRTRPSSCSTSDSETGDSESGDNEGERKKCEHDEAEKTYQDWVALIRLLVEGKADVNDTREYYDWRGCGSTTSAFEMVLPAAMTDVDLLELFLNAGANPNTKSVHDVHSMRTDGCSIKYVLHKAGARGDLEIVRALLDAGAEVDAVASERFHNERGYNADTAETALHQACARGDLAMAALLLARGANVNAWRRELLHEASGQESATDDPREEGYVSPVVCVPIQETPLHIALMKKNHDLATLLVCAGADTALEQKRGGGGRGAEAPSSSKSCETLCSGDETLLSALKAEWTPETHRLFPADVRKSVEAALMIARRQGWPLPDTILFKVCSMAAAPTGDALAAAVPVEPQKA